MADPQTRSKKELVQLGGAAVLLVVLVLFVANNTQKTKINFLVTDVQLPLVVVLLVTAVVGGAITELLRFRRSRK